MDREICASLIEQQILFLQGARIMDRQIWTSSIRFIGVLFYQDNVQTSLYKFHRVAYMLQPILAGSKENGQTSLDKFHTVDNILQNFLTGSKENGHCLLDRQVWTSSMEQQTYSSTFFTKSKENGQRSMERLIEQQICCSFNMEQGKWMERFGQAPYSGRIIAALFYK